MIDLFTRSLSFLGACLLLCVGVLNVFNKFENACDNATEAWEAGLPYFGVSPADGNDYSCLGPWLFWNSNDFVETTPNEEYFVGQVFTLQPESFVQNWTPFFLAVPSG